MLKYRLASKFTSDSSFVLQERDQEKKEYKKLIDSFPSGFRRELKQKRITPESPEHLFPYTMAVCTMEEAGPRPASPPSNRPSLSASEKDDTLGRLQEFLDKHSKKYSEVHLHNVPTQMLADAMYRAAEKFDEDRPANSLKIKIFTHDLLSLEEYDKVESLLFSPRVAGNPDIAYCMSDSIRGHPRAPDSIRAAWAARLRKTGGGRQIEDYGDRMVKTKKTDRPLDDYLNYLDIQEGERDWRSQLLLIGGGNSPIASQLKEAGCHIPVVNIDPIFTEKNSANEDKKFPWNFFDPRAKELLKNDKFDEAWALYSLPMYALSARQVVDFYRQSLTGLRPGGILRVFPCHEGPPHNFCDAASLLDGKDIRQAAEKTLDGMQARPDLFDVRLFTRSAPSFFSRSGFPTKGTRIQLLGSPDDVDDFFNGLTDIGEPTRIGMGD